MSLLPPITTPLNQHSLEGLEKWLTQLGATKSTDDPCLWLLTSSLWSANLLLKEDILMVTWVKGQEESQISFPYGLTREDVETVLKQGP